MRLGSWTPMGTASGNWTVRISIWSIWPTPAAISTILPRPFALQLEEIGIGVTLNVSDYDTITALQNAGEFDLVTANTTTVGTGDPRISSATGIPAIREVMATITMRSTTPALRSWR